MIKKIDILETGKVSKKNLKSSFRCGECLHFKQKARHDKEDICINLGVRSVGIAPSCFTPNVLEIASDENEMLQLAFLWNSFSYRKRRILTAILMSKPKGRKFRIGTKIYFRAVGKDYLSNYLAGYVLGYSSSGELMVSGSPDKNSKGNAYIAMFTSDNSVMTYKEFKIKKQELIKDGRIEDPKSPLLKIRKSMVVDYEPPTIDKSPTTEKVKKKKRIKDLVDTLTEIKIT